jgi:hypothetical protein
LESKLDSPKGLTLEVIGSGGGFEGVGTEGVLELEVISDEFFGSKMEVS